MGACTQCVVHLALLKDVSEIDHSKEPLLKGKAKYGRLPCTNKFGSAAFKLKLHFLLFKKTSYLNEEVSCTDPSPSASLPWPQVHLGGAKNGEVAASRCRPFRIDVSETFGRHFVATRDISPLEEILNDRVAVFGPATKTVPVCLVSML